MDFSYPRNIRFQCLRCGLCCGDTKTRNRRILLLESEANQIFETTSMPIEEFATRIEGYDPYIYEMKKTLGKGRCHFLRDNQCTIYELRPIICGFYPFKLKTAENGKHEFHHTEECPGIGRGKALKKPYFKNLLKQL